MRQYQILMWINLFLSIAFWRIFGIFSSDGVSPVFHAFDTEAAVHGRGSINSNGGTYLSNQRSLPAVRLGKDGFIFSIQILKQRLANELKLPLRDLRVVDPSFPSQIQATFIARPTAILFSIENVKVVVKHDEVIIFGPTIPQVKEFIPALQQQIQNSISSSDFSAANSTSESSDAYNIPSSRFEHVVLETALNVVCNNLFTQVRRLSPAVGAALSDLRAQSKGLDVIQTQVDELLPLKNKLDLLCKRVQVIKKAITEVLNSDEDMAMMYLTSSQPGLSEERNPHLLVSSEKIETEDLFSTPDSNLYTRESKTLSAVSHHERMDTMNLEMLFETYLNEIEWIASEIEGLQDNITNTEENVVLQLDLLRNRILRFELFLSISSFVVTCGALVAGLFGMNLINHMEASATMFYTISSLTLVGMLWSFISFKRYGRRENLF